MTDLKQENDQLSKRVEQLESELTTLKAEFKEFSYIVSHDINAPLRHIDFFTNRIFDKVNQQLPNQFDEDKAIVKSAVDKAKHLISLVHGYSRLATKENELDYQKIDLAQTVRETFDNAVKLKNIMGATFIQTGLTEINGDVTLIKTLFKHILDNALTYSLPAYPPQIDINAEQKNGVLHILIADNGIGMDEKHFEPVFVLLRRAVSDRDYQGDGVGLTMSKKIAQLHGGDLTIQMSKPYSGAENEFHGTVFLLTLPIDAPNT